MDVEQALRSIAESHSVDGDMQHVWGASDLASTFHLKGVGAISAVDSVRVTLQRPDGGVRKVTLSTLTSPIVPRLDKLAAPQGVEPPLFLRDVQQAHWETSLPEHNAIYVQLNQVVNDRDETLLGFGRRLRALIDSTHPTSVVLDVRHNNGGNDLLLLEIIRTFAAFSQDSRNQLYVVIGRRTYSAASTLITDLEKLADPIFVGEASSECCNFHGIPTGVVLPYSKIEGELTTVRASTFTGNPWDLRREMSPDVPVQLTAADYFAGRDPALAAIYRLIAIRKSAGLEGAR
jgi:hypothetical protein